MQPYSPTGTGARTLRLGDLLAVGGSLVVFFFSFAPFVSFTGDDLNRALDSANLSTWYNAWATETFMAPLTWFVILAGLLLVAAAAVRYLSKRDPEWFGFRLVQVELGLALFMLVVLFAMVTSDKQVLFGSVARVVGEGDAGLATGWGAILMLIGALAATAGAVLTYLAIGPVLLPRPAAPVAQPAAPGQPTFGGQAPPGPGQPMQGQPMQGQPVPPAFGGQAPPGPGQPVSPPPGQVPPGQVSPPPPGQHIPPGQ